MSEEIAGVRRFSRFYTNTLGVLRAGLLDSPFSLTEARVVFELAQRDATDLAELRRVLDIDAGYLSRILARLEGDGLAVRDRSTVDGRRQVIRLTGAGIDAFADLDGRSDAQTSALLEGIPPGGRTRLLRAMRDIEEILEPAGRVPLVVLRGPREGDLGWVVQRHGALYAEEYGWDETFEWLVAGIVGDYAKAHDPGRERVWIAEVDGAPAGCVFCVREDEDTARLRLLLVEPSARGLGLGGRLTKECMDFARSAGYRTMVLWTNDVLVAARRIYERAGFTLMKQEAYRGFGHDLMGQDWRTPLQ
jgi:DNA-binding MarR family transcriptional regulator/GNAT superfamily N-acetyltransferase